MRTSPMRSEELGSPYSWASNDVVADEHRRRSEGRIVIQRIMLHHPLCPMRTKVAFRPLRIIFLAHGLVQIGTADWARSGERNALVKVGA